MDDKAKELKKKRDEALKKGIKPTASSASAISSSNANQMVSVTSEFDKFGLDSGLSKPSIKPAARPAGGGKALKLGAKDTSDDQFMRQLQNEGQSVVSEVKVSGVRVSERNRAFGPAGPEAGFCRFIGLESRFWIRNRILGSKSDFGLIIDFWTLNRIFGLEIGLLVSNRT